MSTVCSWWHVHTICLKVWALHFQPQSMAVKMRLTGHAYPHDLCEYMKILQNLHPPHGNFLLLACAFVVFTPALVHHMVSFRITPSIFLFFPPKIWVLSLKFYGHNSPSHRWAGVHWTWARSKPLLHYTLNASADLYWQWLPLKWVH